MRNLLSAPPTDRVGRYPKHTFAVDAGMFQLQPFMLARVLPGETLSNLYCEARARFNGGFSPLQGIKMSLFFFYVRASDLALDEFKSMFVDETNSGLIATTTLESATAHAPTYAAAGGINWTKRCVNRIAETYFRDEGEAWDLAKDATSDLPYAQIREATWMDTLTLTSAMPEGAAIASATDAGDLDRLMDAFQQLRALGLAPMGYEDWLRSQGINIPGKDEGRPELLAVYSDFQYGSPAMELFDVDPAAVKLMYNWNFKESLKKPYFFKEPGFLVGIAIPRPKLYFGNLAGSLAHFADRAWDWMPNYMREMPEATLKSFALGTGPVTNSTAGYTVDMRDELVHGDQFVYDPGGRLVGSMWADGPHLTTMAWKYPKTADVAQFNNGVIIDGFASLNIKGFEVDFTSGDLARI